MHQAELIQLATIIVLGVTAQYLAQILRVPSILVLLTAGLLAGPGLGIVHPDELFGNLMMPVVGLSVALILFEGGLTLRFKELPGVGGVVTRLIGVGGLLTLAMGSVAARLLLGFDWGTSIMLGAILVVTGPTVIDPLVRHIKPSAPVGAILRWEGIVIDPVGATLAVLVFEVLQSTGPQDAAMETVWAILRTVIGGGLIGAGGAALMTVLLNRRLISEALAIPMSVMMVIAAFTLSNLVQTESGLLAVTVMGILLANQKWADMRSILEFKENLRVLLISSLFVVLAARVNKEALLDAGVWALLFAAVLILVVRPVAVFLSTIRSPLNFRQRAFISCMAPRGIVAAAVASVFALELSHGDPTSQAAQLVPVTFVVIVVTVLVYSLVSPLIANRLGIAERKPQGVLLVGAHAWGRELGRVLRDLGFAVLLVDTNRQNTRAARLAGLPTYTGGILTESALHAIDLTGLGRLLSITPNHEVNALACQRFIDVFGRDQVFQLSRGDTKEAATSQIASELRGRVLFGQSVTYSLLSSKISKGAELKATTLTEEFGFEEYSEMYRGGFVPLFIVDAAHKLTVVTADGLPELKPGMTLVSLVETDDAAPTSGTSKVG